MAVPAAPPRRPVRPPPPIAPKPPAAPHTWRLLATVLFVLVFCFHLFQWAVRDRPVGAALFVIPLLVLLSSPLFVRASQKELRFDLGGLMALSLAVRIICCYYRFSHAADGATYHRDGSALAVFFRKLDFSVSAGGPVPGTGGMKYLAGLVSVLTNSDMYASFLVFAWLSFLGCYLFYRAFVTALPEGHHYRYALLIFLWPTMMFWPSSMGKEAWLIFTMGIATLGAARVLVRLPGGYTLMVIGLVAGSFVRPHVPLMIVATFTVALLIGRRTQSRPGAITPGSIAKVFGLIVLIVLGAFLASRTSDLLSANDVDESVSGVLDRNTNRTFEGGSAFNASNPQNPIGYVQAAVTIISRPYLYEAHTLEGTGTSLEALFLVGLLVVSWRRLASVPRRLVGQPYVTFALVFSLMFFFAFGTISNFGILARQRAQLMPYVFVLVCVPPRPKSEPKPRSERTALASPMRR